MAVVVAVRAAVVDDRTKGRKSDTAGDEKQVFAAEGAFDGESVSVRAAHEHLLLRLSQPFSTGTAQRLLYSTYITIHVTNILSFEFSVEADYIVPQTSHLSVVQAVNYNSLLI